MFEIMKSNNKKETQVVKSPTDLDIEAAETCVRSLLEEKGINPDTIINEELGFSILKDIVGTCCWGEDTRSEALEEVTSIKVKAYQESGELARSASVHK